MNGYITSSSFLLERILSMLNVALETRQKNGAEVSKSRALIEAYLKEAVETTAGYSSERAVKKEMKFAALDAVSESRGQIDVKDIDALQKDVKDASKGYGARAYLHHQSKGLLQSIVTDMCLYGRAGTAGAAAKSALGIAAVSTAVGAAAQAAFGPEDYMRCFGGSFEQLASRFLFGAENHASLVPAVATVTAAVAVSRVAVAFAVRPRTEQERGKFQDYTDLKHAQVALKQLKNAVLKDQGRSVEKPEKLASLSTVLKAKTAGR